MVSAVDRQALDGGRYVQADVNDPFSGGERLSQIKLVYVTPDHAGLPGAVSHGVIVLRAERRIGCGVGRADQVGEAVQWGNAAGKRLPVHSQMRERRSQEREVPVQQPGAGSELRRFAGG